MVRGHGHHDFFVLAVFAQEVDAELEVRALHLAVDRLADVVQEGGAHGDMGVEAHFPRHDAGEPRDFGGVREHVLAVARAELQPSHQAENFRVQVVQAKLECDGPALFARFLVGFVFDLLHDLLDARGVNAAVGDEFFNRLLGHLAPVRIEARQDDRTRRVVHDEVDAGGELEGADVSALAPDDAALEIVARQVHDRHRRFDGVFGGGALNRLCDVLLGFVGRLLARLGVEPLEQVGGVVARLALDLLDQELFGLVGREARHALELVLLLRDEAIEFVGSRLCRGLAIADRPLAALELFRQPLGHRFLLGERRLAATERLLDRLGLGAIVARLLLGGRQDLVRFFLGFEQRFLLAGFRVALGVLEDAGGAFFGAADGVGGDAFPGRHPDGKHHARRHRGDQNDNEIAVDRQHA